MPTKEAVQMKVAFADGFLSLQRASPTLAMLICLFLVYRVLGRLMHMARGNSSETVWVAKCADASAPSLNVQAVEEMLDTPNSGLIPSHVHFKNNEMFVTLDSEVGVAKAATLLNRNLEMYSDSRSYFQLCLLEKSQLT